MAIEVIKRADIEVVNPASVKLRGYAGVFNNVFKHGFWVKHRYRVMPGAFKGALERLDGEPLPVFWNHQQERIQIGETTELREDKLGLYYEAKPFATTDALDVLNAINGRAGQRIQASFAFDFGEVVETDDGIEEILSFAAIHEVGPTTWGANPRAFTELAELDAAAETIPAPATDDAETQASDDEAEPADIELPDIETAVAAATAHAKWRRLTAQLRSM